MSIIIRNVADTEDTPTPPLTADGHYYRFEMIADGGWTRVYDDDPDQLLDYLIPGYASLRGPERLVARIRHAVDTQVRLQALINTSYPDAAPTPEQAALLNGPRHIQPTPDLWDCEIPLVLVDAFYRPYTDTPYPLTPDGDIIDDPRLVVLTPSSGTGDYLTSLAIAGAINLSISRDEVAE